MLMIPPGVISDAELFREVQIYVGRDTGECVVQRGICVRWGEAAHVETGGVMDLVSGINKGKTRDR